MANNKDKKPAQKHSVRGGKKKRGKKLYLSRKEVDVLAKHLGYHVLGGIVNFSKKLAKGKIVLANDCFFPHLCENRAYDYECPSFGSAFECSTYSCGKVKSEFSCGRTPTWNRMAPWCEAT